jgi:hypothetical protein
MRTLFKRCDTGTGYCFDDEQFERFRKRLDFISDTLQRQPQQPSTSTATTSPLASQHLVLLCLSRIPRDFAISRDTLHERLTKVTRQQQPDTKSTDASETKDDDFVGAAIKSMHWLADQMTIRRGWCFQIQDVVPCLHVNEDDGSLNADGLLDTLSNLFRTSLSSIQSTPDTFVAKHLIQVRFFVVLGLSSQTTHQLFHLSSHMNIVFQASVAESARGRSAVRPVCR